MIIQQIKHIIVERGEKILFYEGDGSMTEYFNEVEMYDNEKQAQAVIDTFDEPDKVQIMPVKIECSI